MLTSRSARSSVSHSINRIPHGEVEDRIANGYDTHQFSVVVVPNAEIAEPSTEAV